MNILLIVVVYLVGAIVCYLNEKRSVIRLFGDWTEGDRFYALFISLYSWIGFIITAIADSHDSDKPAKW